jgi:DNA polymerase-3 subunit beta
MNFKCEKSSLQKEIAFAQDIISSKNSLSVLSNVLLIAEQNTLTIKATDSKVNFETKISIDITQEGRASVYCDKFLNILLSLPDGEIQVEFSDGKIFIHPLFKKINFQLKTITSEKFPDFPQVDNLTYIDIPVKNFKELLNNCIFAISDDESRYFMNGVCLETSAEDALVCIATDGKRLAYGKNTGISKSISFPQVIIPPKILGIIIKHADDENPIQIAIHENILFVKFGSYEISSFLIDGQFPNYQRVIPQNQDKFFKVNKLEFVDALRRIAILVEQKSRKVLLSVSNNVLSLSTEEGDIGNAKEEIACEYSGEDIVLALNYKYLEDPLKVMNCENIELSFTEPTKAITLNAFPHKDYFHVIMPMQID